MTSRVSEEGDSKNFTMASSFNLCTLLLLLCLAAGSLQGGMKPQPNGRGSLYFPSLLRGRYPTYGTQGLPTGLGYGVSNGYGAGYRDVGYPRFGLPLGGLGTRGKPSKAAGYGAGPSAGGYPAVGLQQAYPGGMGAGGYPSNGLQNGYGNGYGTRGNGFAGAGPQPGGYGNGNGAQIPYSSQLGGPAEDPTATKYGGAGQLPYSGQPQQPEAAGLGGDYSAGRYGNGNGLGYMNGGEANGLGAAGAYSPLAAGKAPGGYGGPLGPGQALGGYGGKESKYGMNGFLGNGYRVRCTSGKC
ncbi:glycine-rich cell wall structural protein 1.0-like isoform X9 [Sceloporus undulatus]|uniref:glycine-rich cell wall structural protein 1.0-like isoform X9 n=1 Tax=Sceloporus undulatus TaxID=8520 RepID=UPI001C4B0BC1|nr:glycine-rich cell wall structural protein 1.0-like isoform X9 [Sceloporus undulatus]